MFIDVKIKEAVVIIQEINSTTVKVKRIKDNVIYKCPKQDLKKID